MKKFLAFLATALAVSGVFWLQTRTSTSGREALGKPENNSAILSRVDANQTINRGSQPEDTTPDPSVESSVIPHPTRSELLKEYWRLLLGDVREDWCPSKRVDMFKELRNVLSMDLEEAKEHLDALTHLEPGYWGDRDVFTEALINQIASQAPVEAVVYLLESPYSFNYEDYENVVRMWMDTEGASVMDWFDHSEMANIREPLARAFFSVYAEEDPYDYLLRYGSGKNSNYNREATALLYKENGASVYENLKAAGLEPQVLADSFMSIGSDLFDENPHAARDWILANRYSVNENAVKQLTFEFLDQHYYGDSRLADETLEWALKQQVFSVDDHTVRNLVQRMGRRNPESVRAVLHRIQAQSGIATEKLLEVLPEPVRQDEEVFNLKPFQIQNPDEVVFYCGMSFEMISEPDPEKVAELVDGLLRRNVVPGSL